MRRHALVTGGAGFIGSNLVEHLISKDIEVSVLDDFSSGLKKNLSAFSGITFYEGTIQDTLHKVNLKNISEIYHLAAVVGVQAVASNPFYCVERNILDSLFLIKFIRNKKIPLLFASSSEVYGINNSIPFKETDNITFGSTDRSRWTYGCSKAIVEQIAQCENKQYGACIHIVRLFNIIGPRQRGQYGMVLPRFVKAALANNPIEVYGSGEQERCFCDVRDASKGIVDLMEKANEPVLVNMGGIESISILNLAQLVISSLKSNSKITYVPFEQILGDAFEDILKRKPCLERLQNTIKWKQIYSLKESIVDLANNIEGDK